MEIYLASPGNQMQAHLAREMNVLISYATYSRWIRDYWKSFKRVLIDSGAYSEFNSKKKIDLEAYRDWSAQFVCKSIAIAGLDDIGGNWRRSMDNYQAIEWSFPTWHDTDPPELLPELISMSRERKTWLGIGFAPPRYGKKRILIEALEKIPESIHVHGWALREYVHLYAAGRQLNSVDSTNWIKDSLKLKKDLSWLTPAECLELVVKRYQRYDPDNQVFELPINAKDITEIDTTSKEWGMV